eukprot:3935879-Prymnesium_polylepis.2
MQGESAAGGGTKVQPCYEYVLCLLPCDCLYYFPASFHAGWCASWCASWGASWCAATVLPFDYTR